MLGTGILLGNLLTLSGVGMAQGITVPHKSVAHSKLVHHLISPYAAAKEVAHSRTVASYFLTFNYNKTYYLILSYLNKLPDGSYTMLANTYLVNKSTGKVTENNSINLKSIDSQRDLAVYPDESIGLPFKQQNPKNKSLFKTSMTGYVIYNNTCSGCHGSDLEGSVGPELRGIGNVANEPKLISFIKSGKGIMPPGGGLTSLAQIKQVADWLMKQTQK